MEVEEYDCELLSSEFLDNLNRGYLSLPTLSTVHFVHYAYHVYSKLNPLWFSSTYTYNDFTAFCRLQNSTDNIYINLV